jgi:hypothetical protein
LDAWIIRLWKNPEDQEMGFHSCQSTTTMPLIRPKLLIETARIGARLYQRERDLAGAIPGSNFALSASARRQIVARLHEAERRCEALRRERSPAYRHARHVQVLAALIAEADQAASHEVIGLAGQTKASGSDALRLAM